MGWDLPWYSALPSLDRLLVGLEIGLFHLVSACATADRVLETYWTTRRGAEAMDYDYALMDLIVYGRQEGWEDSPPAGHKPTITRSADGPPAWDTNTDVDVTCWTAYRSVVPAGRRTL